MIVGRVLQGAAAGMVQFAFSMGRDEFPDGSCPRAAGRLSAMLAVGGATGLVLAGPGEAAFGLDWLFWLPMIVAVAAAVVAQVAVPESRLRSPGRVDAVAALLMSGWLVCLLLGVSRAPVWGWGSPGVVLLLA